MTRKQIIQLARDGAWHNIHKLFEFQRKHGRTPHMTEQIEEQQRYLIELRELENNEQLTFGIDFL